MQPQIALLLCIIFMLVLLKRDAKVTADVSAVLWIPTIWMLIVGSRMVSQWLNYKEIEAQLNYNDIASQEVYVEGSILDRNIFLALIVVGIIILMKRRINYSKIMQNNIWIFLFVLYCGISILWSDYPFVSFKRYLKNIGNLVMVLVVLTEHHPVEAIKIMVRRCAYILIPLSIMLYKYYPLIGRGYHRETGALMVMGVTNNKNSLGVLCLVCGLFLIWTVLFKWRNRKVTVYKKGELLVDFGILIMTLWTLIESNSATSLMCFIMGICILMLMGMPAIKRNVKYVGLYFFLVIFAFAIIESLFDVMELVTSSLGRDLTFTGRTDLWRDVLAMHTNPLIGVGYGSFWLGDRLAVLWDRYWWHPTEAHNGYLEIYLELGLIGLFLLGGVIVSFFKNITRSLIREFNYGRIQIALLVIVLLYNITESAFRVDLLMYFIFLLVAIDITSFSEENHMQMYQNGMSKNQAS